jgi:methylenetetrahydrofolate reductase (NADPH)
MTYLACSEEVFTTIFHSYISKLSIFFLQGQLECNQEPDYANAVTWGLFPGSEVSQPTVIDPQAFLAWKEEAFQIWQEWIRVYPRSSPSHRFLSSASSSLYLVNIVDNNPKSKYAIFDLIEWCQDKLDS